jgi:hypothetical protein
MVQVTHTVRLASLWTRLSRALQGKEVVGVDALGTTYLRYQATNDTGQVVERREFEPADPHDWDINEVRLASDRLGNVHGVNGNGDS